MEFIGIIVLLLIPAWFGLSVFKLVQLQKLLNSDIDEDARTVAVRKRILAVVSLLLSAALIAFMIYGFILLASVEC